MYINTSMLEAIMFNSSIAVCVHRDDVTEQWREHAEKEVNVYLYFR